jgi:hypothetical protein
MLSHLTSRKPEDGFPAGLRKKRQGSNAILEEAIVMKTIFRFLSLAVLAAGFIAAGSTAGFAQDVCTDTDGQAAIYTKFTDGYNKITAKGAKPTVDDYNATIEPGKQFLEKYGNCETVKAQADYLKSAVPALETARNKIAEGSKRSELLGKFDTAIKAKNWDDTFAAGNQFLSAFPNDPARINVLVVLGTIGGRESLNKNYKYNADSTKYANEALTAFKSGVKSPKPSGTYGAFEFDCAKDDCVSVLTYGLGTMAYFSGNKQAGLPYIYEATKIPGYNQKNPQAYGIIGDYYYDSVGTLGDEIAKLISDAKGITDPEAAKAKDAEIKAKIAMFNGYAERAMDAYARAYSLVDDKTPAGKTYKDNIFKTIQTLYKRRFDKDTGVNEYITATVAKPFVDPTTPVSPVADPEPTKDASSTSGSAAATAPATTPTATPKPATPAANKPAVPTKPSSVNGGATTAKKAGAATASKAKPGVRKAGSN